LTPAIDAAMPMLSLLSSPLFAYLLVFAADSSPISIDGRFDDA